MKKILAALLALLVAPTLVFAANNWIATDDFSSYSNGSSLSGANGGSGWTGSWALNAGTITVETSPTPGSPAKSILIGSAAGASADATRAISGISSGVVRVYFYATNAPTGSKGYDPAVLVESGTSRFYLAWGSGSGTGNTLILRGNSSVTLGTGLSTATWHYADIDFGSSPNQARASLDGGAFSSYVTANGGSFSTINTFRITTEDANGSDQGYYDSTIQPLPVATVATSILGLLQEFWIN